MTPDPVLAALRDRAGISDTLLRYGSCIDLADREGLRALLADDLWARYGNGEPIVGGDAVVDWIVQATAATLRQHHMLNVYEVEVDGDTARALVYHTSHRVLRDTPDTVSILVGRYHAELRRAGEGWLITRILLEYVWAERRADDTGQLAAIGGAGPPV